MDAGVPGSLRLIEGGDGEFFNLPILAMPTDEELHVLDTDASNHSIGAILSSIQSGEERVIA